MATDRAPKCNFRLNQRVCRISWNKGQPYLEFGTVTNVTTRTYRVNNSVKNSLDWSATATEAIDAEYLAVFRLHDIFLRNAPKGWTVKDTVQCVACLRRLEKRLGLQ